MQVQMHVHTHSHMYTHTYIHAHIHMHTHTYIRTCMHTYTCIHIHTYVHACTHTVESVYYGHLGTTHTCPDYQGVLIFQVSLYDKAPFGTITTVWIMQVSLFSNVLINKFHCTSIQTYRYTDNYRYSY